MSKWCSQYPFKIEVEIKKNIGKYNLGTSTFVAIRVSDVRLKRNYPVTFSILC